MRFLELTLPTPEENLACDEALLDLCEENGHDEILRFWESPAHFIVLGYSNKTATEVNLDVARRHGVPVLRRCSGGGAVLQGTGCLNYTVILRIPDAGPLAGITTTNTYVLQRHRAALAPVVGQAARLSTVVVKGHSDLARGTLKFSGNAQRRKRRCLLFHGTFLHGLDIELVERLLPMPSRQPDYRCNRRHREFLTNLACDTASLKNALRDHWNATEPFTDLPESRIAALASRYSSDDWNFKF